MVLVVILILDLLVVVVLVILDINVKVVILVIQEIHIMFVVKINHQIAYGEIVLVVLIIVLMENTEQIVIKITGLDISKFHDDDYLASKIGPGAS